MKHVLAIDQGTTGSRAIIYDSGGRVLASAYREFPQYFPKPGWVEHDPEEIWQSVYATIQTVLTRTGTKHLAAIGLTNQRETTVVWDAQTGKPVHRAIVWQCRRTAERCRTLQKNQAVSRTILQKCGLPVDAYFSATKLEWILQNVPRARVLARLGRLRFGTPDTWVLWKLTGGAVHATDFTNASRTMLFNLEKRRWDPDLINFFRIPAGVLPQALPSSGIFGRTAACGKLPAGIPIAGIAGDQQAALFGQAGFAPGSVKNTYGTGCFLLLNAGNRRPRSQNGLITTLACGPDGQTVYALEGSIFIAGAAIQWLRDGLQILETARASEALARSLPENEGVYFVPALVGLGAPYWDSQARGTITGLTRGTTRAHLVRAALEAMAYATRDVLAAMRKDSGLKFARLKVDGGAAANRFLCQFQADVAQVPVVVPKTTELTALGAAYLAGLAVGVWPNTRAIEKIWQAQKIFMPRITKSAADRLYAGWQAAVRKTRA
ncbi:MAG: glycerol kinase GlpK [Candidatus Firestonebacteria bacterium]|nr:glycerol kinase GlpK [Candidatus Firestonebacteria bacterium]